MSDQPTEAMFTVSAETQLQVVKEQRNSAVEEAALFKAAFMDSQSEIVRLRQVVADQQLLLQQRGSDQAHAIPAPGPVRLDSDPHQPEPLPRDVDPDQPGVPKPDAEPEPDEKPSKARRSATK